MKLTHRISTSSIDRSCETLLDRMITRYAFAMPVDRNFTTEAKQPKKHLPFASLSISTNNLEDHIRADALERLLRLNTVVPQIMFDRDKELDTVEKSYSSFLSGCYYQDNDYWTPGDNLDPLYFGFHIHPYESPKRIGRKALAQKNFRYSKTIHCKRGEVTKTLRY